MHQTSPARPTETAGRDAAPPSFRQAALIGHFGAFAQWEGDLDRVVYEACRVAAEGMGAKLAGVLQYRADEDAFVLQAGFGWPARMVGRMRVTADLGTTAGLAWLTCQLAQCRESDAAGRTRAPEALVWHGAHRMVSVPIRNDGQGAFGVLEVGVAEAGEITGRDLTFLQSIADGVAAAAGLQASRAGRTERVELAAERIVASAGRLNAAAGRQGPAGTAYQQDARAGAG